MQCLGCSCGSEVFAGDIIQHCLGDCSPSADALKVTFIQCMFKCIDCYGLLSGVMVFAGNSIVVNRSLMTDHNVLDSYNNEFSVL